LDLKTQSQDSSVSIEIILRAGRLEFNSRQEHRVQIGSGAHPVSYPMGTGSSFPGDKAAGAWSWPLPSILCRG